ncbi:MAG: amidohydrolase [Bryobacterales bacterium]|nr:amidohydrolase [Bryobacterales bacterium]
MRLSCFALLLPAALFAQAPDLILHNGKIVTVDDGFTVAQAFAVRGDRIAAVGPNDSVLRLRGASTRVIDLQGKTVLPGLIDSHVHATGASMYEFDHPIGDMETVADVLNYIRSRAAVVPEGEWIVLQQVFITRLREQRYPTRAELDQAAPRHPVAFRTGPDASLNSLALARSGITRDKEPPAGATGKVERDLKTKEPTGIVRGAGEFLRIPSSGRRVTLADREKQLKLLFTDYNSLGITSVADRNAGDDAVELYRGLRQRNELTCRVFLSYSVNAQAPEADIEARMKKAAASPLHRYDNFLWLRGIKVFLDGGMLTGSAYMRQPWGVSEIYSITDPNYRGMLYIQPDKLRFIARTALMNELQPTAHSVGDGAVHALIDAYEAINKEKPVRDGRPCITHCNFMSLEAVRKMAELGIVADLQPAWLERDGATLHKQFGAARLRYFQPYKTLFEHGVKVGGGSDHMQKIGGLRSINPYHPFFGMWIALARQPRWTDQPVSPEERITRQQAIRLYTTNNAFLTFEEKEKGSIEPGKLADFFILTDDILTCPLDRVKDIAAERTWVGGKLVWERK